MNLEADMHCSYEIICEEPARRATTVNKKCLLHKIGRNEPCPCGSGKKFKKCCYSGETRWLKMRTEDQIARLAVELNVKG